VAANPSGAQKAYDTVCDGANYLYNKATQSANGVKDYVTSSVSGLFYGDTEGKALEARREDVEKAVPADLTEDQVQGLLFEGDKPYRNTDRSEAGRAKEKHASRPGSAYPPSKGNAEAVNRQGQEELERILRHPNVKEQPNSKGGKDYVLPDGKGARYKDSGEFETFLEPS